MGAVTKFAKEHGKSSHDHLDSISHAIAGPTVLGYGLSNLPNSLGGVFTQGGFFALAGLAVGAILIGRLVFNELTHL